MSARKPAPQLPAIFAPALAAAMHGAITAFLDLPAPYGAPKKGSRMPKSAHHRSPSSVGQMPTHKPPALIAQLGGEMVRRAEALHTERLYRVKMRPLEGGITLHAEHDGALFLQAERMVRALVPHVQQFSTITIQPVAEPDRVIGLSMALWQFTFIAGNRAVGYFIPEATLFEAWDQAAE